MQRLITGELLVSSLTSNKAKLKESSLSKGHSSKLCIQMIYNKHLALGFLLCWAATLFIFTYEWFYATLLWYRTFLWLCKKWLLSSIAICHFLMHVLLPISIRCPLLYLLYWIWFLSDLTEIISDEGNRYPVKYTFWSRAMSVCTSIHPSIHWLVVLLVCRLIGWFSFGFFRRIWAF